MTSRQLGQSGRRQQLAKEPSLDIYSSFIHVPNCFRAGLEIEFFLIKIIENLLFVGKAAVCIFSLNRSEAVDPALKNFISKLNSA